ncbi:rod shape-determining protein MreC [Thermotalea metallivorans]|uniref:Cell shape-determining protein MreC n=1 Tax=Thermotalea metallivorans TaxID=520762 RepID=A0A140L939_9FIRM|nr:rod shape-determining protein MreC [Thermotalea metallivorans]KXG77064.1 Cell shape-determining protein MreC [Thermotalea metallivorans]
MIVTAVTIILIILMGISLGGRMKVTAPENMVGNMFTPIQKIFYKAGQGIENTIGPIFRFRAIDKENKKLREEIEKLQKEVIQYKLTADELEELRNLSGALDYTRNYDYFKYTSASVSAKDPGNWYNIFTIDKGSSDGIQKDSTVLNGSGLVGKVFEVGDHWAKVITIIDNKSSVSFEILRNNAYMGVIRGSVKADLSGYLIDPQAEVLVGDKLITSGLSTYPKGILIGEVKEVVKKKDELLKTIIVEPAVNFKKIDKVLVILSDK